MLPGCAWLDRGYRALPKLHPKAVTPTKKSPTAAQNSISFERQQPSVGSIAGDS